MGREGRGREGNGGEGRGWERDWRGGEGKDIGGEGAKFTGGILMRELASVQYAVFTNHPTTRPLP